VYASKNHHSKSDIATAAKRVSVHGKERATSRASSAAQLTYIQFIIWVATAVARRAWRCWSEAARTNLQHGHVSRHRRGWRRGQTVRGAQA